MASDEAAELRLLGRVEMKLATAESTEQVSSVLGTFLCPVIMKLASPSAGTKAKVIEILRHVSKRLAGNQSVQLPLKDLISLLSPSQNSSVQNFAMVYTEMAFQRENYQNKISFLPQLLSGIGKRSQKHRDRIFEMLAETVETESRLTPGVNFEDGGPYFSMRLSEAEEKRKEHFLPATSSPSDVREILGFLRDILFLNFRKSSSGNTQVVPGGLSLSSERSPARMLRGTGGEEAQQEGGEGGEEEEEEGQEEAAALEEEEQGDEAKIPAGLSPNALKRVEGNRPVKKSEQLHQRKVGVLKFLCSGLFIPNDILPHLLVAMCDRHHTVQQCADDMMKRTKFDLEDKKLIAKLFLMFSGTEKAESIAVDNRRSPVNFQVRIKILEYFSKSIYASNYFPPAASVISLSVFSNEKNSKLQNAGLAFLQWCFRHSEDQVMEKMAGIVLAGLLKCLDETGTREESDLTLRGSSYKAIGLLATRIPKVVDLPLLVRLFIALSKEDPSVSSHLQDALSMICPKWAAIRSEKDDEKLLKILHQHILPSASAHARRLAVRYSVRCFPFSSAIGRMICLICSTDSHSQVKEEATKGLQPYTLEKGDTIPDNDAPYPSFFELLNHFHDLLKDQYFSVPLPSVGVVENVLLFLRTCLQKNSFSADVSVKKFISCSLTPKQLDFYVGILEICLDQAMEGPNIPSIQFVITRALLEVFAATIDERGEDGNPLLKSFRSKFSSDSRVRHFAFCGSRPDIQEVNAKLLAVLSNEMEDSYLQGIVSEGVALLGAPAKKGIKEVSGGILVVGFVIGESLKNEPLSKKKKIEEKVIQDCLKNLFENIEKQKNPTIVASAIQALGNIGRYSFSNVQSIVAAAGEEEGDGEPKSKEQSDFFSKIVSVLTNLLVDSPESKVKEQAALALGNLSLGCQSGEARFRVAKGLMKIPKCRHIEVQFSIGEALSCAGAGWGSRAAMDPLAPELLRESKEQEVKKEDEKMEEASGGEVGGDSSEEDKTLFLILKEIFGLFAHTLSAVRVSALVWLLSLVKFSGDHPVIQQHSERIQQVFCEFLGDGEDVVQELAGRGLLFLQQYSGGDSRDILLSSLLDQLTGKKTRPRTNIPAEDAELLPGMVKLSSSSSASKSTYKEMCNLAAECGQPDLIYSMMAMTSQHAVWNSRKGAAFAVGEMLGKGHAKEAIRKHLRDVIPKMYRHSYDPNPRLAQSMGHILSVAYPTKGNTSLVDENLNGILEECLTSMGSREWRARQAGCSALSSVLPGRRASEIMSYIERMWTMCFRCVDDIKETVAQSGIQTTKSLANLCVRLADKSQTSPPQCHEAASISIDYLSGKGVENEAATVRQFSIGYLVKILKVADHETLKKKCPSLIPKLLESLSTLEVAGDQLNYLSMHTDKVQKSKDEIDNMRVNFSKDSPMQEALGICAKHICEDNYKEVAPGLIAILKRGVGLQTRVGAPSFVIQMSMLCPNELKLMSGRILQALPSLLEDISSAVRNAGLDAAAYVARVASSKAIDRYVDVLANKYMVEGLERHEPRVTGSLGFRQLARLAKDQAGSRLDLDRVAGIIFFGMDDRDSDVKKYMTEVWEEIFAPIGGTRVHFKVFFFTQKLFLFWVKMFLVLRCFFLKIYLFI